MSDLSNAIRRRFVLADHSEEPEWDPNDPHDVFWAGVANAEMAAHHDEIDCAACGSSDVVRMPMSAPWAFATVAAASGRVYGIALCRACCSDMAGSVEQAAAELNRTEEG